MNKERLLFRLGMQEDEFERIFGDSVENFFDTNKNDNLEFFLAKSLKDTLFNK